MAEQKNPLREWRGENSYGQAAWLIGCDYQNYVVLETHPELLRITSENILHVQAVTQIPLATLIDYFEQRESV